MRWLCLVGLNATGQALSDILHGAGFVLLSPKAPEVPDAVVIEAGTAKTDGSRGSFSSSRTICPMMRNSASISRRPPPDSSSASSLAAS